MAFLAPIFSFFAPAAAGAEGLSLAALSGGTAAGSSVAAALGAAPVVAAATTSTAGSLLTYAGAAFSALQGLSAFASGNQNAAYADAQAKSAKLVGEAEYQRQRRINAYQEGLFKAEAGAQGTTLSGSPFLVYLENVKQGELMAQDKKYQGKLTALGYKQQASNYRMGAQSGLFTGLAGAASSLGSTLLKA